MFNFLVRMQGAQMNPRNNENRYQSGSGVGAINTSVYRAKLRHAGAACSDNNQCIQYSRLGMKYAPVVTP